MCALLLIRVVFIDSVDRTFAVPRVKGGEILRSLEKTDSMRLQTGEHLNIYSCI